MKKYSVIFVLGICSAQGKAQVHSVSKGAAESDAVTKGAVIEGLFIVQNKQLAVKQAIQDLKKELADSFKEKQNLSVPVQGQVPSYQQYHEKLKQLLYPTYIDELGLLAASMEKDIAVLNGGQPVSKPVFDLIMKKAFLAGDKVDVERKLLLKTFEVDKQEYTLTAMKHTSETYRNEKGRHELSDLIASVATNKKEVAALKVRLIGINKDLYTGDIKQEFFLDRLAFRRK